MISLNHDTLSITFPEIAQQVRSLVERQIQKIASLLPPLWDRTELLAGIESSPLFKKLTPKEQDRARTKVNTGTPEYVEAILREVILNRGGLNTDAFAGLSIRFQRTMRLPDDGKAYPLPTGLGQLPLRSVDDFSETAPVAWIQNGGVIMPLAQNEGLWIWFSSRYRFAVKIGTGKINALSGEAWSSDLRRQPQNYLVAPGPRWGGNYEVLSRYVAMPLGPSGSTGDPSADRLEASGICIEVVPLCVDAYYRDEVSFSLKPSIRDFFQRTIFAPVICDQLSRSQRLRGMGEPRGETPERTLASRIHEEMLEDPYEFGEWDQTQTVRCFAHHCDSLGWRKITGRNLPHPPLTAEDYEDAGIPWFDDYRQEGKPLPEDTSITPDRIVQRDKSRRHGEIREFLSIP